eukprot:m.191354 g.191354  ORF g.191354 m.191354 type:complete len:750 (+) comp18315_c0_seq1:150-2399(+)
MSVESAPTHHSAMPPHNNDDTPGTMQDALSAAELRIQALERELARSKAEAAAARQDTTTLAHDTDSHELDTPINRSVTTTAPGATVASAKRLTFPSSGPTTPDRMSEDGSEQSSVQRALSRMQNALGRTPPRSKVSHNSPYPKPTSTVSATGSDDGHRNSGRPAPFPNVVTVHMIRDVPGQAFGFSIEQPTTGGRVFVKRVWRDSAAETAGLCKGDMVISMDGNDLRGVTPQAVLTMVKNAGNVLAVEVVSASDVQRFPELRGQLEPPAPLGPVPRSAVPRPVSCARSRAASFLSSSSSTATPSSAYMAKAPAPPATVNPNVSHWGPHAGNYPFKNPPPMSELSGPTGRRSSGGGGSGKGLGLGRGATAEEKRVWVSLFGTTVQAPDVWTFFLGWRRWKERAARQGLKASYATPPEGGPEGPGEPLVDTRTLWQHGRPRLPSSSGSDVSRADSSQRLSVDIPAPVQPPPVLLSDQGPTDDEFSRAEAALYQLRDAMQQSRMDGGGKGGPGGGAWAGRGVRPSARHSNGAMSSDGSDSSIEAENRRLHAGAAAAATTNNHNDTASARASMEVRPVYRSSVDAEVDDIADIYGESLLDDTDTAWEEFKSMFESAGISLASSDVPMAKVAEAAAATASAPSSQYHHPSDHHTNTTVPVAVSATAGPASPQPMKTVRPAHVDTVDYITGGAVPTASTLRTSTLAAPAAVSPGSVSARSSRSSMEAPRRSTIQLSAKGIFAKKLAEVKAPQVDL